MIEACIGTNNFDIVILPETFLDSSIPNDDHRIYIAGYSLLRADHPSNTKKLIMKNAFLHAFIGQQAKIVINLVISVKILVYFLTI